MELGQLRALRELGDRGSIAAVAAALRVTPSSVSQQISALQRHSPAPLTFKDGRRTALTDAGRALAAAAIDVEVALERANQAVPRFRAAGSGTVSVTAFSSAGLTLFGPLLSALNAPDQPQVRLHDFDVAQEQFASLTAGHDLVIAHRLIGSPPWPASVRAERLVLEPLDIVLRRDHRLAEKESLDPSDLAEESWAAVREGFPLERALGVITAIGGTEARVLHRVNDFAVASAVVAASGCIARPGASPPLPAQTGSVHRLPCPPGDTRACERFGGSRPDQNDFRRAARTLPAGLTRARSQRLRALGAQSAGTGRGTARGAQPNAMAAPARAN
jgi:DNA-binding transcriptional LysR family regulator